MTSQQTEEGNIVILVPHPEKLIADMAICRFDAAAIFFPNSLSLSL